MKIGTSKTTLTWWGFGEHFLKPLSKSQFVQALTNGINNDGYWTSYFMAIQLEDCVDHL